MLHPKSPDHLSSPGTNQEANESKLFVQLIFYAHEVNLSSGNGNFRRLTTKSKMAGIRLFWAMPGWVDDIVLFRLNGACKRLLPNGMYSLHSLLQNTGEKMCL
jgi:hypothetical protein